MCTYAFKCPKGKLYMSHLSKRLVGIAASTALLSLVSAAANAQTDFHNGVGDHSIHAGNLFSEYYFKQSMILNSIGFLTDGVAMTETSYSIDSGSRIGLTPASIVDSNGFQWYEFSGGMSINAGTTLYIHTNSRPANLTPYANSTGNYNISTDVIEYKGAFPSGFYLDKSWMNSNIRVTNPGSNVAPEPGSFALALTGGAALLGICIRRRRNAA
jgi:hypothetical protein